MMMVRMSPEEMLNHKQINVNKFSMNENFPSHGLRMCGMRLSSLSKTMKRSQVWPSGKQRSGFAAPSGTKAEVEESVSIWSISRG